MAPPEFPGTAGLILCGGQSSRMGRDKAGLRFGKETLLERVVRRMRAVADPVLVAVPPRAARQAPPSLPAGVIAVPDRSAYDGPLMGLAEGFRRLQGESSRVLVMAVDMPFFTEPWLARLAAALSETAAAMYRYEGFQNALTAGYRLSLLPKLERLIAEGARRPIALAEGESPRVLTIEDLWRAGEGPPPLMDVDRMEDYRDALRWEGLGDAQGLPVWAQWRTPEESRESDSPADWVRIPLWARTAAQALALAARVYPEWAARLRAAGAQGAARVIRGGAARDIGWEAALQADDTLVLEC